MELLTIAHGSAVVELDELDCLRLTHACRAAERAAMGDTSPFAFLFRDERDHWDPGLVQLFSGLLVAFTAAAMAAHASSHNVHGDAFDLERTLRTWLPVRPAKRVMRDHLYPGLVASPPAEGKDGEAAREVPPAA